MDEGQKVPEENDVIDALMEFEHLDLSERVEPEVYTVEFVDELCTEEFEFRTIEEHNLCVNKQAVEIAQEDQVSMFFGLNIMIGLFIGYVGIKGMLDPWR